MNKELINKITKKKEFSQLPEKDIKLAFSVFDKEKYSDEEKIKLTRDLLRKVYSGFASKKILSLKNKSEEWFLRKHLSTKERLPNYKEIYIRLLKDFKNKKIIIFDLGSGINGFSYKYLADVFNVDYQNKSLKYIGVEAIKQLVDLMNYYFKNKNLNAQAINLSLFELDKIKKLIKKEKGKKIIFLFKVIDSLEMLKRNYSKKLISEIAGFSEKIVISYSTKSMQKRKKFYVKRTWLLDFIKKNFIILDEFEVDGEKYICFKIPDKKAIDL